MMRFLRTLAGIFVGKLVLRAQLIPIGELNGLKYIWSKLFHSHAQITRLNGLWDAFIVKNNDHAQQDPNLSVNVNRELLTTPQGVNLDTVTLSAKDKNPTEYIIYGWGRNDCYEYNLSRLASDALNLNKKIISFNYRGVGRSVGQVTTGRDLVDDYKFQITRLIQQGVPPERIMIYGHSLGGAIATFAVEELHREGYPVKIYVDRSFSSLVETSVALYFNPDRRSRPGIINVGTMALQALILSGLLLAGSLTMMQTLILGAIGYASTKFKPTHAFYIKTVGWLLEKGMRFMMDLGGWEYYTPEIFEKIPDAYRSHANLIVPKETESPILGAREKREGLDKVVLEEHSLHKNLAEYRQRKAALKEKFPGLFQEQSDKLKALTEELTTLSNSKMTGGGTDANPNGHMSHPETLFTWYKDPNAGRHLSGIERFYGFVEPDGHHQDPSPRHYINF